MFVKILPANTEGGKKFTSEGQKDFVLQILDLVKLSSGISKSGLKISKAVWESTGTGANVDSGHKKHLVVEPHPFGYAFTISDDSGEITAYMTELEMKYIQLLVPQLVFNMQGLHKCL